MRWRKGKGGAHARTSVCNRREPARCCTCSPSFSRSRIVDNRVWGALSVVFNVDASNADAPESVLPVCYVTAVHSSLQSAFLKNRKNNRVQNRGNSVNAFVFVSYQSPPVNTSVAVARPSTGSVLSRDDTATRPSRRRPAVPSPSDERNQTVDRQRHDRIERHAQPVRPPSGANLYVRQA